MTPRPRGPARTAAILVAALLVALLAGTHGASRADAAWADGGSLPGLGTGHVWSVAMNPAAPAVVIAGTDAGVYRSEDGGVHWSHSALATGRVWVVGFDVRAPNPAFAGLDGGGIQRSDDGGKTWAAHGDGLPSGTVRSLAFGLGLIAAGTSNGVAISPDGQAWRPSGLTGYDVSALTVAANSPATVLIAGIDNAPAGSPPGTLFRSTGPTDQWEHLDLGVQNATVSALTASALPQPPALRTLVACTNLGVYRSNDGGNVWQKTYPTGDQLAGTLTTATFSPVDPALLYAGDDAGGSGGGRLLRSTDAGLTFAPADAGLPADHETASIAVAPASPPLLVAGLDPAAGGRISVQTDASAPAPQPTGPPENAAALPSVSPPPVISVTPQPRATPPPTASSPSRFRRFVDWPLPLSVELVTVVLAIALGLRWRRRHLNIEGPP